MTIQTGNSVQDWASASRRAIADWNTAARALANIWRNGARHAVEAAAAQREATLRHLRAGGAFDLPDPGWRSPAHWDGVLIEGAEASARAAMVCADGAALALSRGVDTLAARCQGSPAPAAHALAESTAALHLPLAQWAARLAEQAQTSARGVEARLARDVGGPDVFPQPVSAAATAAAD